jgi:hypothetical protein
VKATTSVEVDDGGGGRLALFFSRCFLRFLSHDTQFAMRLGKITIEAVLDSW